MEFGAAPFLRIASCSSGYGTRVRTRCSGEGGGGGGGGGRTMKGISVISKLSKRTRRRNDLTGNGFSEEVGGGGREGCRL